jgi:hypothetical protein
MVGVKNLPERHRTGFLRTGGDNMAVLWIPAGIVVNFCACIECHPLEALVDAMSSSPTLYDTESESRGLRLSYFVVRVYEVNLIERIGLELPWVEAPFSHLIEEVGATGPVLYALKITVETSPTIRADLVYMHLTSRIREIGSCSEAREACP